MESKAGRLVVVVGMLAITAGAVGCTAATAGKVTPISAGINGGGLDRYTSLTLETEESSGVALQQGDKQRIADRILSALRKRAPARFSTINPPVPDGSTLQVRVQITRYDEGNAFARFMLAGLGQIHIDADVLLQARLTQEEIGKYQVAKTFAWGGLYGGTTKITDVEEGFAEAVASAILNEKSN